MHTLHNNKLTVLDPLGEGFAWVAVRGEVTAHSVAELIDIISVVTRIVVVDIWVYHLKKFDD